MKRRSVIPAKAGISEQKILAYAGMTKVFKIKKLSDWDAIAKMISPLLKSGTIIALSGPLGAGKTTFVQALARTLGAKVNPRSPTFSLIRAYAIGDTQYPAKPDAIRRLVHVDAYRIDDERDLLPLNLEEELREPGTIMALEWPENIKKWLAHRHTSIIQLDIKLNGSHLRTIRMSFP